MVREERERKELQLQHHWYMYKNYSITGTCMYYWIMDCQWTHHIIDDGQLMAHHYYYNNYYYNNYYYNNYYYNNYYYYYHNFYYQF